MKSHQVNGLLDITPALGLIVPELFPGLFTTTLEIEIGVTEVT